MMESQTPPEEISPQEEPDVSTPEPDEPRPVDEVDAPPAVDEYGYTQSDMVDLGLMPRDQVAMLYHASFYLTNDDQPLPAGHPPTHAQLAQMHLAEALGEAMPEEALMQVQRAVDSARDRAARMQQQRNEQVQAQQRRRAEQQKEANKSTPIPATPEQSDTNVGP